MIMLHWKCLKIITNHQICHFWYISLLNSAADGNNYYFTALFITDIIHNGSYVLYSSRGEEILRKVYKKDSISQGMFLEDVISRKKQILPGIMLEMEGK